MKHGRRARSVPIKKITKEQRDLRRLLYPEAQMLPRPTTRAECINEKRPCPWVGCKYHMYLDVNEETGTIKINFPELEPEDIEETCALDIAAKGGLTLEEIGDVMNITRERVRQIEEKVLRKIKGDMTDAYKEYTEV